MKDLTAKTLIEESCHQDEDRERQDSHPMTR